MPTSPARTSVPTAFTTPSPEYRCDVLVIGGGPGGSTISAFLAQKGRKVVLLEKEHHPRFHIGESLLPLNLPLLQRLGVLDQVDRIGLVKPGAEFNYEGYKPAVYYFANAMDKSYPSAYEVRRSEFDNLLLRNSAAKGTDVREGDRKSTRLNSSHVEISYAVFCLKKKKQNAKCRVNITNKKRPYSCS